MTIDDSRDNKHQAHHLLESLTIYRASLENYAVLSGCTTDLILLEFLAKLEAEKNFCTMEEMEEIEDNFLKFSPPLQMDE